MTYASGTRGFYGPLDVDHSVDINKAHPVADINVNSITIH
jgi:hypothetical protein